MKIFTQHYLLFLLTIIIFSCSTNKKIPSNAYEAQVEEYRQHYKQDFITTEQSPLDKKDLKNLSFFNPDSSYRLTCVVSLTPDEKPFELSTYSGQTKPFRKYAELSCPIHETEIALNVYQSLRTIKMPGYRDYLFLPFKDATNGEITYGGGRYIDLKTGDIDKNEVIIDFNKAYNPWCAYSEGYNCPIPPRENHLEIAIQAGEKNYLGKKKK